MNRSGLLKALASKYDLNNGDVAEVVRVVLEAIAGSLENGNRVEIRGYGSFHVVEHAGRIGRNPKTGQPVDVPPKKISHFKPGK